MYLLYIKHDFVCLSDTEVPCDRIELQDNLPGWWSKLELFRKGLFDTKVLYFDLDTVFMGNIDLLAEYDHSFSMLRGFREATVNRRASGIMAWNGDYSFIYDNFKKLTPEQIAEIKMDQKFIKAQLEEHNIEPDVVQEILPGVVSYKNDCRKKKIRPEKLSIICFHGKPRPHEAVNQDRWIKKRWN